MTITQKISQSKDFNHLYLEVNKHRPLDTSMDLTCVHNTEILPNKKATKDCQISHLILVLKTIEFF